MKTLKRITLTKPTRKNESEYYLYNAKDVLDQTIQTWRDNIGTFGFAMSHEYNYEYDQLKEAIKTNDTLKNIKKYFTILENKINRIIEEYNHTLLHGLKKPKTIQEEYNELKKAYLQTDPLNIDQLKSIQKQLKKIEDNANKNNIELNYFELVTN